MAFRSRCGSMDDDIVGDEAPAELPVRQPLPPRVRQAHGPWCVFLLIASTAGLWFDESRLFDVNYPCGNIVSALVLGRWQCSEPGAEPKSASHEKLQSWAMRATRSTSFGGFVNYEVKHTITLAGNARTASRNWYDIFPHFRNRVARQWGSTTNEFVTQDDASTVELKPNFV